MNVAETLEAGAKYIERHGWAQQTFGAYGKGEPHCIIGSLIEIQMSAYGTPLYDQDIVTRCSLELGRYLDGQSSMIWNDCHAKSKEEVIATMRACAAIWRAKHEECQNVAVVEPSAEESHA